VQKNICGRCNQSSDNVMKSQGWTMTICDPDRRSSDVAASIMINNVSSYYFVSVCIAGMEISALVDTGAGLPLLSGRMSKEYQYEPVIHQKLFGVDAILEQILSPWLLQASNSNISWSFCWQHHCRYNIGTRFPEVFPWPGSKEIVC